MNSKLQREIISHIFSVFGLFPQQQSKLLQLITDQQFLLNKQLAFETEEGKHYTRPIHAMASKIDSSEIKVLVADTTDENSIAEYTMLIRIDDSFPFVLRLSEDQEDSGSLLFYVEDNKWIAAGTLMQAKILVGVESLTELLLNWKKLEDYNEMYKSLVGFLNWEEMYER